MEPVQMKTSDLKRHCLAKAQAALEAAGLPTDISLAAPPKADMGDFGFPCFAFARIARKAPQQIAVDIVERLEADAIIGEVSAIGPYVNFTLRPSAITRVVLSQVLTEGDRYGSDCLPSEERQRWMVEYSGPNTNKPQHLGHVRNNLIGDSVARLLEFAGHTVYRANIINDRGIHICKSMLAYQRFGEGVTPESSGVKGDHLVGRFYVLFDRRFSEEYGAWLETPASDEAFGRWLEGRDGVSAAQAHAKGQGPDPRQVFKGDYKPTYFNEVSELGAAAKQMLLAWEAGDEDTVSLWKRMNGWVFDGFDETYQRLGVSFDRVDYESQTYLLGKELVLEGLERGVFHKLDDGAVVFDLAKMGKKGQKVVLRADGTSVYITQDIGTALSRFDEYSMQRMAYVVADEQAYHFEVLFGILGQLREELTDSCYHLSYGMVHLPEGKMKSREGTVVDADDLMDGMRDLAAAEIRSREGDARERAEGAGETYSPLSDDEVLDRAERIGKAALKYYLLNFTPRATITFDPARSIDFLGQTGPYCLYSYARVQSLLARSGVDVSGIEVTDELAGSLSSPLEQAVLKELQSFPDTIAFAARNMDSSKIADHVYRIAKSFSSMYNDKGHQIVGNPDQSLERARLALARAVGHTVRAGLAVLGIETVDEM